MRRVPHPIAPSRVLPPKCANVNVNVAQATTTTERESRPLRESPAPYKRNLSPCRVLSADIVPPLPRDTHQAAHRGQDYVTFRMKQISEVAATKKRRRRNGIGRGRFNLARVF